MTEPTARPSVKANVCSTIVSQDLCIGCGACAGLCPTGNLRMQWTKAGQLAPLETGHCPPACHLCLDICPFQDREEDEDTLATALYGAAKGIRHTPQTGFFLEAYAGHANGGYRERGASGGLASWFLANLLAKGTVEHIICVRPKTEPECLFEYAVLSTPEEVRGAAKSAYYPVEISGILRHLLDHEGRYAVVALPCVAKALRLASQRMPLLQHRLVLLAGLVCGQTKSRGFAEYLLRTIGLEPQEVTNLSFRSKNPDRPANNFELRARTSTGTEGVCVWGGGFYADTWCSGMFTPRACTLCDDIFAETSDIVFMDAWLPEYTPDSRGTSIALVRSAIAHKLIEEGIAQGAVKMEPLPIGEAIASQAGVVELKRTGLSNRLWLAAKDGLQLRKRVASVRPSCWRGLRLKARESVRRASHEAFVVAGSLTGSAWLQMFEARMRSRRMRLNAVLFPGRCVARARLVASRCIHFFIGR